MALLEWPADLPPKVRADGFERVMPDLIKPSRMAAGVTLTRPIALAGEQTISCMIRGDRGLLARFDRFFLVETGNGARPFLMRDQLYDGVPLFAPMGGALTTPDDEPIAISFWRLVRFTPASRPATAKRPAR
ncbi:hypothetical protein [Chenggangzhangella methanolivorans]|uniref:Uncharacterized protein n=1 Tax=Chenggangzhangella methanolivorans TaxID=1437009 RepID=A0A9E6R8J9_9HYPH|nr:hypothetical protein [Chenggangzhangella methanolivorans]QZN99799.1 hypothetical protein K6K41_24570 [Chenggangzhangella methanolivorans]